MWSRRSARRSISMSAHRSMLGQFSSRKSGRTARRIARAGVLPFGFSLLARVKASRAVKRLLLGVQDRVKEIEVAPRDHRPGEFSMHAFETALRQFVASVLVFEQAGDGSGPAGSISFTDDQPRVLD